MIKIVEGDPSVLSFLNESEQNVFRLKNWFNPFSTNIPLLCENNFNYLWKHQKAYGFLMFSGGKSGRLVENGLNIVTRGSRSQMFFKNTSALYKDSTCIPRWNDVETICCNLEYTLGVCEAGFSRTPLGSYFCVNDYEKFCWNRQVLKTVQLATQDFLYQCKTQNYDSRACWY